MTCDVNYVPQSNSSVQLLATLRVFQPFLRDVLQTSTELFVKSAVVFVCDNYLAKMASKLVLQVPTLESYALGAIAFSPVQLRVTGPVFSKIMHIFVWNI